MAAASVLVVDDDPDIRVLLGEELGDLGYDTVYAVDALQAVSVARRDLPDLILLDLRLPGGDGLAVLERLKSLPQTATIPVIILTGVRSKDPVDEAMRLGAFGYVRKSLTSSSLGALIESALSRRPAASLRVVPPLSIAPLNEYLDR